MSSFAMMNSFARSLAQSTRLGYWLLWGCFLATGCGGDVVIGAKTFPESGILAEAAAELARQDGQSVRVRRLNGTKLCWTALIEGNIDAYPEYTGTLRQEIFGWADIDDRELPDILGRYDIHMTKPLGFNNSYALGVMPATAQRLNLTRISDMAGHRSLRFGFSNEFTNRADGWPGLKTEYQLDGRVRGMEHALAYEALKAGDIDVVDVYSTDANVKRLGLVLLEDDRQFFPRYDAVFIYSERALQNSPDLVARLQRMEGTLSDDRMTQLNQRVAFDKQSEAQVAAEYLREDLGLKVTVQEIPRWRRVYGRTKEHLLLVVVSLTAGIATAVPLGVIAAKRPLLGSFIVGGAEIVQTIPGLALLIFLGLGFSYVGLSVIGELPVIAALFLYSLLPIIRNTMAGIQGTPLPLLESAKALGLPPAARLWRIELPMASPMILAGVKTTAVMNVGFAALGGLIGAGGYGQPILTGLTRNDKAMMLEGAIPAALMAISVKWAFEFAERFVTPAGLRLGK